MAITASELQVKLSSSGGATVRRSLSSVKEASQAVGRAVSRMGGNVDGAGSDMVQAAGATQILNSRLDATESDFNQVANAARSAAVGVTAYGGATTTATTASAGLSAALSGGLIVSLATMATILGPLVATLGGLAAGFISVASAMGTVIATGAASYAGKLAQKNREQLKTINSKIAALKRAKQETGKLTQAQRDQLKSLKKQRKEVQGTTTAMGALANKLQSVGKEMASAFAGRGETFAPLIRDAINALPQLAKAVNRSLGDLTMFAAALRDMGSAAQSVIPRVTGYMMDLARQSLPMLRQLGTWLRARGPAALAMLEQATAKTLPLLEQLARAAVQLGPPLLRFGQTVASVVLPVLSKLIRIGANALRWFNNLPGPIRTSVAAVAAFAGVIAPLIPPIMAVGSALTTVLVPALGALTGPLGAVALAVGALATAFVTDFANIRTTAKKAASVLSNVLRGIGNAARKFTGGLRTALSKARAVVNRQLSRMREELGLVPGFFRRSASRAQSVATSAYRQIRTAIASELRALENTVIKPTLQRIQSFWIVHGQDMLSTVQTIWRDIVREVRTAVGGDIVSTVRNNLDLLAATVVPLHMAAILRAIADNWAEVKRTTRTALRSVVSIAQTFMASFKKQILNPASTTKTEFGRNVRSMFAEARESFQMIRDIISRIMGVVLTRIREHLGKVTALWKTHLSGSDGILANARTAFNALYSNIIEPILNRLQHLWQIFGDDIIKILDGTLGTLLTIARIGMDAVLTAINVILDLISGDFEGAWNNIKDFVFRTIEEIADWAGSSGKKLLNGAIGLIVTAIMDKFWQLYKWLIGNSLIKDMINDVVAFLEGGGKAAIDSAIEAIKSSVMGIFASLKNGVENTIDAMVDSILDKVRQAISDLKSTFNSAIPDELNIPSVSVGGGSIDIPSVNVGGRTVGGGSIGIPYERVGGQSINLPQLDTGGFIESGGLAILHAGEQVVPKAQVDRSTSTSTSSKTIGEITIVAPSGDGDEIATSLTDELRSHGFNV